MTTKGIRGHRKHAGGAGEALVARDGWSWLDIAGPVVLAGVLLFPVGLVAGCLVVVLRA